MRFRLFCLYRLHRCRDVFVLFVPHSGVDRGDRQAVTDGIAKQHIWVFSLSVPDIREGVASLKPEL